jgi:hypothetical protein
LLAARVHGYDLAMRRFAIDPLGRPTTRVLSAACLVLVVGCAARDAAVRRATQAAGPGPSVDAGPPAPPRPPTDAGAGAPEIDAPAGPSDPRATLVWGRDDGGARELRSLWIRTGADGAHAIEAERLGAFFVVEGDLWRWRTRAVEVPLVECDASSRHRPPSVASASGDAGAVVRAADGATREVMPAFPWTGVEPSESFRSHLALIATLGPYVMAELFADFYICGQDDSPYVSYRVVDVRDGTTVEVGSTTGRPGLSSLERWLLTPDELAELHRTDRVRATRAIRSEILAEDELAEPPYAGVYITEVSPSYRPGSGFGLEYLYSLWWCLCDGCGDGEWAGCTNSVRRPAPAVPRRLAEHLASSGAADWLGQERPALAILGISPIPADRAEALRQLFSSAP